MKEDEDEKKETTTSSEQNETKILYVAMDNRPVNIDYPPMLSKERISISNSINDSTLIDKLKTIFSEIDSGDFTNIIISFDNLLYNGLLESRATSKQLNQSDKTMILDFLDEINEAGIEIDGFTSSQRVAPSIIEAEDMKEYNEAFKFNDLLTKSNLSTFNSEDITFSNLDYYNYRSNKLADNMFLIEEVAPKLNTFYIGQDDTQSSGIQKYELHHLKSIVKTDNVIFMNGTDELAVTLIAKILYTGEPKELRLHLLDEVNKGDILAFEGVSLEHLLVEKQELYDFVITEDSEQPLWIINNGKEFNKQELFSLLENNEEVILTDFNASNNERQVMKYILEERPELLQKITVYSSWNTASNAIGLTLTQFILSEENQEDEKLLEKRILKDYFYKTILQHELKEVFPEITQEPYNISNPEINLYSVKRMNEFIETNLSGDFQVKDIVFTWKRLFEIEIILEEAAN